MNTIKSLLVTVALVAAIHTQSAATLTGPAKAPSEVTAPAASTPGLNLEFGVEPYGVISWTGLKHEAVLGAGISPTIAINKNLSLVGFLESDDTYQEFVERFGAGVRYTAYLGKVVSLDGGVGVGHDTAGDYSFVRLPLGANFNVTRSGNLDLYFRAAYAFDITGNGKRGESIGRLFFGPVFNFKF